MLDLFVLGASASWDPFNVLDGAVDWLKEGGAKFLTVLGIVCILFGGVFLARIVFQSQQKGRMFVAAIIALVIGAVLTVGGLTFLMTVSEGGFDGIKDVGEGAIVVPLQMIVNNIF